MELVPVTVDPREVVEDPAAEDIMEFEEYIESIDDISLNNTDERASVIEENMSVANNLDSEPTTNDSDQISCQGVAVLNNDESFKTPVEEEFPVTNDQNVLMSDKNCMSEDELDSNQEEEKKLELEIPPILGSLKGTDENLEQFSSSGNNDIVGSEIANDNEGASISECEEMEVLVDKSAAQDGSTNKIEDGNFNMNENEDASANDDANVNENDDTSANDNANVNENEDASAIDDANVNENEDASAIDDANVNENEDASANDDANMIENDDASANDDAIVNENDDANVNKNGDANVNKNDNAFVNENDDANVNEERDELPSGGINVGNDVNEKAKSNSGVANDPKQSVKECGNNLEMETDSEKVPVNNGLVVIPPKTPVFELSDVIAEDMNCMAEIASTVHIQ